MEENTQLEDIIEDVTVEQLAAGLELEQESTIVSEEQVVESEEVTLEEEPKIIDKRSDKEIEQDNKAVAGAKADSKGDMQKGDQAIITAMKDDKVKEHLKKLGKGLDQGGSRRLVWVLNDKTDETDLMAYRVNHGRLDNSNAKLVMKSSEKQKDDSGKISVNRIIAAVLKVAAPEIKGNDKQVVVKVGSESEAQKLIDKVKENNKKATSKDHKARAALYKRKDGFKVYITGETPAAVSAYKSMAESDESYDDVDNFIFENIIVSVEYVEESYEADLAALTESEANLTESFKEKAAIIFEAALTSKVREEKEKLAEQFETQLSEQTSQLRVDLAEKVDNYLTYVVESWVEDNKVAIESGLRTEIAENFISALKTVFVENYIEVPESKKDLVSDLEIELAAIKESATQAEAEAAVLNERVEELVREKIISEAGLSLADTQAAKLASLVQDVEFVSEDTFRNKVETIKEAYFSNKDNVKALEESNDSTYETIETIVEGEDFSNEISPSMAKYLTAVSRLATAKG